MMWKQGMGTRHATRKQHYLILGKKTVRNRHTLFKIIIILHIRAIEGRIVSCGKCRGLHMLSYRTQQGQM
jgi:hypothetical protein